VLASALTRGPDGCAAACGGTLGQSRPQTSEDLPMNTCTHIEPYRVNEHARNGTLPRHFGRHMLIVENLIYNFLRQFSSHYTGGYWHFYELSNGGFYMAPELDTARMVIASNGFEDEMSGDAAGITVCLFTFSHLSFEYPHVELFARHFHRLRDFAVVHAEAQKIFGAID
jgi:hypothetical protein